MKPLVKIMRCVARPSTKSYLYVLCASFFDYTYIQQEQEKKTRFSFNQIFLGCIDVIGREFSSSPSRVHPRFSDPQSSFEAISVY